MNPEPSEEPNPFDELETGGEIAAFVYKKFGENDLRHFLADDGNMLTERE